MNKKILFLSILTPFILIFILGCGRKASPVPPGTIRPVAIKDLGYKITEQGVELSWSVPVRNRDGSPLAGIKGFQLLKAEIPLEDVCSECPPPFGEPIFITYESKPEEARKIVYEDRTLRQGMRYVYEVRTVKGWLNVSDSSNRISIAWHSPPLAPKAAVAVPMESGILVRWKPPESWSDGMPIDMPLSYKIYRSLPGRDEWTTIESVSTTSYFDKTIKRQRKYRYKISAVLDFYGTKIEGPHSKEVSVESKDITPPAPPKGLVGVSSVEGVELLWQENSEPDLEGYIVYRMGPGALVYRLNHKPVTMPRFVDRTKLTPGRYKYWITAVDKSIPPNESTPSQPAEILIEKR